MTYRCGIGSSLGALLGLVPGDPHVRCDDCGAILPARTKSGIAPMWLLRNRAPRGWLLIRTEDPETGKVDRQDYCPRCRSRHELV